MVSLGRGARAWWMEDAASRSAAKVTGKRWRVGVEISVTNGDGGRGRRAAQADLAGSMK